MQDIDPEKAAGAFIAFIFGAIRIGMAVIDWQNKRKMERINTIPPTVCPVPEPKRPSGPVEVTLQKWTLEEENAELRTRLATLDLELRRSKAEQARTALALAQERDNSQALKATNDRLIAAGDSGYTRLPPPQSRTGLTPIKTIVEVDDRDTPPQGTRVRR